MLVHRLLGRILNEYTEVAGIQRVQSLLQNVNSLGTAVSERALSRYSANEKGEANSNRQGQRGCVAFAATK
jgi:hypothetical protein